MFEGKFVSAVIPAAGNGTRMGAGESKIWLKIKGKTILEQTLSALCEGDFIDEMIILGQAGEEIRFRETFGRLSEDRQRAHRHVPRFLFAQGGSERLDSVYNGLQQVSSEAALVLVHDGARPLVTEAIIREALQGAVTSGAAVACVPTKDTIKLVRNGFVTETPDRAQVFLVQTPQCFNKALIMAAYEEAKRLGVSATDDAGLVEQLGTAVRVTAGSYENIKVTTPEDLLVAEAIINSRENKA